MKLAILILLGCAVLSNCQHTPFPLLIDEAHATIICNPQPTPELIRWHRQKVQRT